MTENEHNEQSKDDLNYYVHLRKRVFELLEEISTLQFTAGKNAKNAKNVSDFQTYNIKITLHLKALSNAVTTCNTILNNISRISDVDSRLKRMEKQLEALKHES